MRGIAAQGALVTSRGLAQPNQQSDGFAGHIPAGGAVRPPNYSSYPDEQGYYAPSQLQGYRTTYDQGFMSSGLPRVTRL